MPALLTLWGIEGDAALPATGPMALLPIAVLVVAAAGGAMVLSRIGVPAPWMLGGLLLSSVGHATELSPGLLPVWLTLSAFIVMGTLIGTRFRGQSLTGIGVTLAACSVAAAGAMVVSGILGLSPALLLISFAPGGVEVMAAMAIQIGVEPTFVAAHHVFRLLILTVLVPVLVARTGPTA